MASTAPKFWVARDELKVFRDFCERNGHETREHTDSFMDGCQVRHQGHWMAVVWSGSWQRYTADRRLSLIVQSFAAEKSQGEQG